jgi:cystathionine beta-lyase/cystathionine gamma-synthase
LRRRTVHRTLTRTTSKEGIVLIDTEDIRICLSDHIDDDDVSSLTVPIVQTSLFAYPDFQSLLDGLAAEHLHHVYTRGQNPTVEALERKLAALEGGVACKCFASGMGAISAVLLGLLKAGDHVLFVNHVYGPTLQLAAQLRRFGIDHDVLLDLDPDSIRPALRPNTRMVWLESPGTMLFRVADIAAVAAVVHEREAILCVDNSWATPLLQKPLALGADIVVHSASKYIGGHSDVMAGAVIAASADVMEQIFYRAYMLHGALLAPHDAWLVLRGLRTLPVRLQQHEADGVRVAEFLDGHPAVSAVFHPLFASDPAIVASQMRGFSGLFSFALAASDFASVRRVIDALRVFRIGVSWGGVESLVISPNRGDSDAQLDAHGVPRGLIRLSTGLEGADVLIADLDRALSAVA